MDNYVVTISRCCGGDGTSVGKMLAKDLGVSFYARNLLKLASEDSGINEELFEKADEKVKSSLLYKASKKVYNGELIPPDSGEFTSDQNLFNYQAKVLKELALNESYVVVGRCANFVLKDFARVINIYIYAPYPVCVERMMEQLGISRRDAEALIAQRDKGRKEYCRRYTGQDWDDMKNYDICLNSASVSYEKCVEQIRQYINLKLS